MFLQLPGTIKRAVDGLSVNLCEALVVGGLDRTVVAAVVPVGQVVLGEENVEGGEGVRAGEVEVLRVLVAPRNEAPE